MSEISDKKGLAKRFSRDFVYSVSGLVCMNVIIQFVLYPVLESWMGAEAWGYVLSLIAVISIICVSFPTGANYSHVVRQNDVEGDGVRGDYNIFMALTCLGSIPICIISMFVIYKGHVDPLVTAGFTLLMIFSLLRYYGDVEYKLTVNYKGYFIYYLCISAGYLLGIGTLYLVNLHFGISRLWWVAIIAGEVAGIIYVCVKGHIFRRPLFKRSPNFKRCIASTFALVGAYLLSGIVMNADRLLLLAFVSGTAVTVFYVSTLLGKTVALLTAPLDGVIIGYLTKHDLTVTRSFLGKFSLVALGAGVLLSAATIGMSYLIIWILYSPDVYEAAKQFFVIASIGQVFYFLGEMMLVVVLRIASERYQLYINIGYTVLFFAAAVPGVMFGGIWGLAIAILCVNLGRFLFVIGFGLKHAAPKAA